MEIFEIIPNPTTITQKLRELNSGIQQSKGRCKIWFPVWHVKMKYNHPTNFPTIPGTEQCLLGYWVIKMHCQMNECHAQNGQTQW